MSNLQNSNWNDYLADDYTEAMIIIVKAIRTGRQLTQFKLWEQLEPEARIQAVVDSFKECARCYKKKHLSKLNEQNTPYGTFYECIKPCKIASMPIERIKAKYQDNQMDYENLPPEGEN